MPDVDTQPVDTSQAFDAAFSPPEPAVTGGDEGGEGSGGQPRDDHGRFAPTKGEDVDGAAGQEQPQAVKSEPEPHRVPLGEYMTEREKRQAAEREREELRQRLAAFEQRQQQPPQRPDPMSEPEAFAEYLEQRLAERENAIDDRYRRDRLNASFSDLEEKLTEQGKAETFTAAYEALQKAPQDVKDEVFDAVNPGRAMLRWHGLQRARTEVGDDLDGFKQKHKSELMTDPEFRKEFMAALDAEARGGDAGRSSTVTSLPSVNRAPGSAGNQRPGSLGDGPEERFSNAFAPRRRA